MENAPNNCSYKRLFDNTVQLYNLASNEETDMTAVKESLRHVRLSYHGLYLPLSEWFGDGNNCTLTYCWKTLHVTQKLKVEITIKS